MKLSSVTFMLVLFFALFDISLAVPTVPALLVARASDRFDPRASNNLIGPIVISAVVFVLAVILAIYQIHQHRIGIASWFRRRNPSLNPLPPSPIWSYQAQVDRLQMEPRLLELDNLGGGGEDDGRVPSRQSLRGFLGSRDSGSGDDLAEEGGSGLVGLGIMNNDAARPTAPGGPITFGVGFQRQFEAAVARFGPPPTPPPASPAPFPPPAAQRRRRSTMLQSLTETSGEKPVIPRSVSSTL